MAWRPAIARCSSATRGIPGPPWPPWSMGASCRFDGLRHLINGSWEPSPKTTPTDIASYLWSVLAAERLKIIGTDEAHRRLDRTLRAVGRLERVHGFFYEWLDPRTGAVLRESPYHGGPISPVASCVDNGWLAAALIMVPQHLPPPARAGRGPAEADGLRLLPCRVRRGRSRESSRPDPRAVFHRPEDLRRFPPAPQHRAADHRLHRDRSRTDPARALLPRRAAP